MNGGWLGHVSIWFGSYRDSENTTDISRTKLERSFTTLLPIFEWYEVTSSASQLRRDSAKTNRVQLAKAYP